MNNFCEVIQDLLPLYIDNACSTSSADMINAHLENCDVCKDFYKKLHSNANEIILKNEISGVVEKHRRQVNKKRIFTTAVSVFLTIVLIFLCINLWPSSIDYGSSEIYSREEMDAAIDLIKERFNTFEGCKLYTIYYTDDDFCKKEVDYVNTLSADGVTYTQCIVFRTRFRSPIFGGGAWNANAMYDWSWYLARTDGGAWELLTWGMP